MNEAGMNILLKTLSPQLRQMAEENLDWFLYEYGVYQSQSNFPCIRRIVGKRHLSPTMDDPDRCQCDQSTKFDHAKIWHSKDNNRAQLLTCDIYDITNDQIKYWEKVCTELGLKYEILGTERSFYFPGSTNLVVFSKK